MLNIRFVSSKIVGDRNKPACFAECLLTLALHYVHIIQDSFSCWHEKPSGMVWTATALNWDKSFTHIEHRTWAVGREPAWWTKSQVSLLNIYFVSVGSSPRHYVFTSSTVRKSVRARTYSTYDAPKCSRLVRHSFAPSQKLRQNRQSCVWTEPLSGTVFASAQKLTGIMWTKP